MESHNATTVQISGDLIETLIIRYPIPPSHSTFLFHLLIERQSRILRTCSFYFEFVKDVFHFDNGEPSLSTNKLLEITADIIIYSSISYSM